MKLSNLALFALAPLASAQTTWYVSASATPPGLGTQAAPYSSIQYALSHSSTLDGDTIQIAAGTYSESLDFVGKAVHVVSASGPNVTIVDGGQVRSVARFVTGEGLNSVLEGLTLRNGIGEVLDPMNPWQFVGGGIFCDGTSPTIRNCTIHTNGWEAMYMPKADEGGGVYVRNGSPSIESCNIYGNGCWQRGGGMQLVGESGVVVTDTTISGNVCGNYFYGYLYGGGVNCESSLTVRLEHCSVNYNFATRGGGINGSVEAYDCDISGNQGVVGGGALYAERLERCTLRFNHCEFDNIYHVGSEGGGAHSSYLVDCTVEGNSAGFGGGVALCTVEGSRILRNRASDPNFGVYETHGGGAFDSTLVDCELVGNSTDESFYPEPIDCIGGALAGGSATRCDIRDNLADEGGAAVDATLVHCTVVGNRGREGAGGVRGGSAASSILWHNTGGNVDGATTSYCLVGGGSSGTGDFDADPKLWNPVAGDFELTPVSPCIDTANPADPLDGDGSRADVGAHPFDDGHAGAPLAYCTAKTTAAGCVPTIGSTGTTSQSGADNFYVVATHVRPSSLGFVFWGMSPLAAPFHGGFRCVAAPLIRSAASSSAGPGACDGVMQKHFTHAELASFGLDAYDTFYAQAWFRDPAHPDGSGIGISDALEVTLTP